MIISEKIFNILNEKGISQKAFSEKTGISQSTISDWKRKGTNPSADKIITICDALDISVYELLNDTEESVVRQSDYILLNKKSEEYLLLETYQGLDSLAKARVLGYMDALNIKNYDGTMK